MSGRFSKQSILESTARLPYSYRDQDVLITYIRALRQEGIDLAVSTRSDGGLDEMIENGAVVLKSASLNARFLLVNADVGRGFLGLRKSKVFAFFAELRQEDWHPLLSCIRLETTISGVMDMFRAGRRGSSAVVAAPTWPGASG